MHKYRVTAKTSNDAVEKEYFNVSKIINPA